MTMRLLTMGPPGAGKGTRGLLLARYIGVPGASTGDISHRNVADLPALGKTAKRYMDADEYVPGEITNAMVDDGLSWPDVTSGFFLDGYPSTLQQVGRLDEALTRIDVPLSGVVVLAVDEEELVRERA